MKNKSKISFETDLNPKLLDRILVTLYKNLMIGMGYIAGGELPFEANKEDEEMAKNNVSPDGFGLTLLELNKVLKPGFKSWHPLRLHLMYLEDKGFIEERHFLDGITDYALENKGIKKAVAIMNLK